jgi:hypothetical protein
MPLESRSVLSLALAALAACSTTSPPEDLAGTSVDALSTIPPLPTSGTASYKFLNIAANGVVDGPYPSAVTITGTGATRTLQYNVFGNNVTRTVRSDGRQPDTDTEQQANVRMFGTLPPAGTPPQIGASWTIPVPTAVMQRLSGKTASGVASTRPIHLGTFSGFVDLQAPAGFSIARAVVKVKNWGVRPGSAGGLQPGLVAIGVVDLAISNTGAFVGIIPLRAAYFSDPAGNLPDSASWQAVQGQAHMTDLYCLTAEPGVPASLIASVPTIPNAPFPTAFSSCTH